MTGEGATREVKDKKQLRTNSTKFRREQAWSCARSVDHVWSPDNATGKSPTLSSASLYHSTKPKISPRDYRLLWGNEKFSIIFLTFLLPTFSCEGNLWKSNSEILLWRQHWRCDTGTDLAWNFANSVCCRYPALFHKPPSSLSIPLSISSFPPWCPILYPPSPGSNGLDAGLLSESCVPWLSDSLMSDITDLVWTTQQSRIETSVANLVPR